MSVVKQIAVAMKTLYDCDGITLLQNNEPAGGQHAFHYHLHIFPRYEGDDLHLHMGNKQLADPAKRLDYTTRLHKLLN